MSRKIMTGPYDISIENTTKPDGFDSPDISAIPQNSEETSPVKNTNKPNMAAAEHNNITPELLVDALSGHEDGLLAIAERLMLSYNAGYDAMGEAIIDAFADVQRLFQHVVEAAHMEGAAFESARRDEEWRGVMERVEKEKGVSLREEFFGLESGEEKEQTQQPQPHRHEELIDQDVKDVLLAAIKKSHPLLSSNRHDECQSVYEKACHSASALLPVDSDHRGRLQLATARAESMCPDRSCAILRYAMDDVLRSGLTLREGKYREEDRENRGDCVLSRVDPLMGGVGENNSSKEWNSLRDIDTRDGSIGNSADHTSLRVLDQSTTVEQSAEEALASLVEEMKEILQAPVYATSPLLTVSDRFWLALGEAKKSQARKEERLEQALAMIKADFLLAREEWEDQLSQERTKIESIKKKFNELKSKSGSTVQFQNNGNSSNNGSYPSNLINSMNTPNRSQSDTLAASITGKSAGGSASPYHFLGLTDNNLDTSTKNHNKGKHIYSSGSSVVSMGSEFAQRAKNLVHLINCQGRESEEFSLGSGQQQHQRRMTSPRSSGRQQ